ncbi:MAG: hypothetical protein ABSH47_07275 [Bryobacteraceae bacterium]|jgi:hypothetical protein
MQAQTELPVTGTARNIELEQKLKRMTLLVGAMGSDGIILAADKLTIDLSTAEDSLEDTTETIKIVDLPQRVAYAFAGDILTLAVADELSQRLKSDSAEACITKTALENLANRTLDRREHYPLNTMDNGRTMLIVSYGTPDPRLWRLRIIPNRSQALAIDGMTIAGAVSNTARFFHYYYQHAESVQRLKLLVAHTVLAASRIGGYIRGLDMCTFQNGQSSWISQDEKAALTARSDALDRIIRGTLFPLA